MDLISGTQFFSTTYKLGTRLLYLYKVIKDVQKGSHKINEHIQINEVNCRKIWKPYCEPFQSLTIIHLTKTTTIWHKKGAILEPTHKAPKLHIFCATDLQHTTTVHWCILSIFCSVLWQMMSGFYYSDSKNLPDSE